MRAVRVIQAGGALERVEREMPAPAQGEVPIRVEACGVCHTDSLTVEGQWPGVSFPRIPGHEVAGVIDAVGAGVVGWSVGQRVGVGWFGGHCGWCEPRRRGWLIDCRNLRIPGISYDGGYADTMLAPADALAAIPDELSALDAVPLLCAGVTTFNALRHSGAMPGDVVAILGIGGLGHLGVQFANKLGFRTVAIARGSDKEALSRKLGAHHHRQRHRRRGDGTQPLWRCAGRVGDGDERQGDDTPDRGAGSKRPTNRRGRRCRADRGFAPPTDWCQL